eukprot:TRINITY_DN786_c0_g2_i1.p1 TRINITY_DN786_c0_g2~~TRINITY_DN786_c0_g2_i1.p1  ORF type:complete len:868 (+),score=194.82 TRINITY_DN786_c0_g2_i1:2039-4642(+)
MVDRKPVFIWMGTFILLCVAIGLNAAVQNTDSGRAVVNVEAVALNADNFDKFAVEGKEADAIYGDVSLRNKYLSAVIAQPLATRHANMTTKDVAGALIDLSARGTQGSDQLAAFYPGRKLYAYRKISLLTAKGEAVPPEANASFGEVVTVAISADGTDERAEASVTYELKQDQPFLTVTTTFTNRSTKPITVALEDDFRADSKNEEMSRSPNGVADHFWLCDRYWGQAYGLDADGYKLQITSDARITTIKYVNRDGESSVPLPPGESFRLQRRLYPGSTIFDVQAIASKDKIPTRVEFAIDDGARFQAGNLMLELQQGEQSLGMARFSDVGELATNLLPGDYNARVHFCGNPTGAGEAVHVEGGTSKFTLKQRIPRGRIVGNITDIAGGRIPCKIELKPLAADAKLDFGPETAEFALRNLIYTANGEFTQTVPPGRYAVTISHGPEFDIVQTEVMVKDGEDSALKSTLVRSVETPGWVSSDFHSHSTPSGDNTSSQLGRVLNLVCEHVEFAPCTEHNRVSSYAPHIKRLGIENFLASVSGIELTGSPLPLNHQNAFPIKHRPRTQDGGGPVTGPDLESQIERLILWDDRSEKLLQVNHPDMGWMFYDKNGDGKPDAGFERAFPFMDVVEIHPIEDALHLGPEVRRGKSTFHNTVFNWLQLLNQGFRIYGVVNTDAHYNYHGSGSLRNWIQSPTDAPAKIDHMEMVHAAEQGRLIMSNGPYLEVTAAESGRSEYCVAGQDLKAASGKVIVNVRVQCPNWLDVNRVFILVNGRAHLIHDYTRTKNPDAFRSGVLKFERVLEIELKGDANLVVVTGQVGGKLGSVHGPNFGNAEPAAISNPIFVDVDGNGFQPNKDTLDAPLPVKHSNSK